MIQLYNKSYKNRKYYFIITLILLSSFLSYEAHIYEYYSTGLMVVSALLMCLVGLFFLYEKEPDRSLYFVVRKNYGIILLFACMILLTILGRLFFGMNRSTSVLYVLMMLCCLFPSFFILPVILNRNHRLFEYFINFITLLGCILAIFTLIIYYNPNLLPYDLEYGRAKSIYFDPNYCAMVLGIVLTLNMNEKKIKRTIAVCFLFGYAILLTGSRGTFISIIVACCLYILLLSKLSAVKKLVVVALMGATLLFLIEYLQQLDFFREEQGLNGRDELIAIAMTAIKKSPIIGYGYQSIGTYLIDIRHATNASTHNTFVDYAFSYGLIATLAYILIIVKNFSRGMKNNSEPFLMLSLTFMIINSNSIVYSFGGIGIGSLLFTIILGIVANRGQVN